MNNEKANKLLADVRALTVELHDGELTSQDCERLQLMVDIFRQIRADGAPDYPIMEYVKNRSSWVAVVNPDDDIPFPVLDVEKQTEREDYSERCSSCGEPYAAKDINAGRCLCCGTMICSEDPNNDPYIARSYLGRQDSHEEK